MMVKKINRLLLVFLLPLTVLGQKFHTISQLDSVKENGFYAITIDPELSTYLKTDLSDIRVKDDKNNWVPHIIHYPFLNRANDIVNDDLPIISNSSENHFTTVICNNTGSNTLSNLVLLVKNTASNRFSSISGSDDQLHWFSVIDSFLLSKPIAAGGDKQAFHISIPVVNYKYVRFIINDYNKDPLNILEVYTEADGKNKTEEKYITNPNPSFIQEDSTGYSLIKIRNTAPWHINEILFSISFPKYFERHAKLFTHYSGSIKDQLSQDAFSDFWISSNNNMPIEIPLIKADSTYILVENDDNPPLKIDSISSSQL
ncbi:MAG: hypothetical protein JSU05_01145, partial [Bacteroidetes bacterium]|nr:hypothetical protein [Bacteroidota bacterium]